MKHAFRAFRSEPHSRAGGRLYEIILGGQDGMVNVLGLILGVASATANLQLILISGLAATFAESISMAAVAYTSTKAEVDYYKKIEAQEKWEMRNKTEAEKEEIREIYRKKGFSGRLLDAVANKIFSNKKVWLQDMMVQELNLPPLQKKNPLSSALIVGVSAIIGSVIPLIPFVLGISIASAMISAVVISAIALFIAGAIESRYTVGNWKKKGAELALIGMGAAVVGFLIGKLLGSAVI
ncbi:MAG: VIT1/CCC1 transporter family protein [Candidatus Diapherotrites archaeon]|uniref:VIT1/CCC1 transporter family protein n=1 Tax=Candidatus Iainarchaeum sp. TaxID=3101447 RepID=A0A8T4L2J0_9ARCH|nr:VIT1/CCC1 transporter family protein [Candidatus Diapherotrites archaeon]